MARKPTQQQPPEMPLYLVIERDQAEQKIDERIQRGKEQLRDLALTSKQELTAVRQMYSTWDEYNEEMLRQMFTSPKLAEEYTSRTVSR